ncbi:MAG: hypothetical protein KJ722_03980 [Candidatus Omnitrophica bacterium]|nr:hypothetical protein [Candidatus Omnitrophota bacterium]
MKAVKNSKEEEKRIEEKKKIMEAIIQRRAEFLLLWMDSKTGQEPSISIQNS